LNLQRFFLKYFLIISQLRTLTENSGVIEEYWLTLIIRNSDQMRFFLIFIASSAALFAFFYFYSANIFNCTLSGEFSEINADLSLKAIFFNGQLPAELISANIIAIKPTLQGYMILFICLIGLPLMIAYRFSKPRQKEA
jgi:hypothetical protein